MQGDGKNHSAWSKKIYLFTDQQQLQGFRMWSCLICCIFCRHWIRRLFINLGSWGDKSLDSFYPCMRYLRPIGPTQPITIRNSTRQMCQNHIDIIPTHYPWTYPPVPSQPTRGQTLASTVHTSVIPTFMAADELYLFCFVGEKNLLWLA